MDAVSAEAVKSLDEASPFNLSSWVGERSFQGVIYPDTDISYPMRGIHQDFREVLFSIVTSLNKSEKCNTVCLPI